MDQETVINYVVIIVVVSALTVGLISMLFGKLVDLWDSFWSWWGRGVQKAIHTRPVKTRNMSSSAEYQDADHVLVSPVVATFTSAEQSIVTPNNEYSGGLSDKEKIAFETTAKNIAAMYQKGVVTNLSKAICAAYGCTVQSAAKTDSIYQMALKAVNRHLPKKDAPQFRTTPEMENAREALGLNKAR